MNKPAERSVAIIGGGFCGLMTAVQLSMLTREEDRLEVILFSDGEFGKGPAYSTHSKSHLLNVEARNMSAFPDSPDHFIDWLEKNHPGCDPNPSERGRWFAPRKWYGDYLAHIAAKLGEESQLNSFTLINDRAIRIERTTNGFIIETANDTYCAGTIVLATGNVPPGKPKGIPASFTSSQRYVANPWTYDPTGTQWSDLPVVIAGTGLTMVDMLVSLRESGFAGGIHAISPKGFEILPHRRYGSISEIKDELAPPYRLDELFRLFRKHIRIARSKGITGEAVVDAVRPLTQQIWASLNVQEKKRFLAHLRHLWGLARHRLPPAQHADIKEQMAAGTFSISAGRILDISDHADHCVLTLKDRKSGMIKEIKAGLVINCTGPATDLQHTTDPLYRSLLAALILFPDPLGMGILANNQGIPLDSNGKPVDGLYAIGSLLKGTLWESTAIPELRNQCKMTAEAILAKHRGKPL